MIKINFLFSRIKYYLERAKLPLILALLFVAQNFLFHWWLNTTPSQYFVRRTLATASLGVLFFGPAVFMKKRSSLVYLFVTTTIVSLIFLLQFLYYSYFNGFLQASALLYASEGLEVISIVGTMLSPKLIMFVIGPAIVAIYLIFYMRGSVAEFLLLPKEKMIVFSIMLTVILSGYGYLFAREYMESGTVSHLYQYRKSSNISSLVNKVGIFNYSLVNLADFAIRSDEVLAADADYALSWIKEPRNLESKNNFGVAKGRNLIFILVESLDNAVINEKIQEQEIMPQLNQLAKEGLYFSNYYTQTGAGTTSDAEFSILNSLYPLPDSVVFIEHAFNRYHALPETLKENGYYTAALHGDAPSFWNRANMYPSLGYVKWFGIDDFTVPRIIGGFAGLGDDDMFKQSIVKLQSFPQPFMSTLITITSHSPFEIPEDLQTLTIPNNIPLGNTQKNYLQSVHYADMAIGNFIADLKKAGLYDNSVIVIAGDHGSLTKTYEPLHITGKSPLPELMLKQVPFILLIPGTDLKGVNNNPASHLDFYPTIANLLGVSVPTSTLGQDLLNTKKPLYVYRNLATGTINSFLTEDLAYRSSPSGIFTEGYCYHIPDMKLLNIEDCRAIYDKETEKANVSDLIIRGDLLR